MRILALALLLIASTLEAASLPSIQDPVVVREVLAVESLGVRRRSAVYTDALEARLARGEFGSPAEGEVITSTTGTERTWARLEADENGWFQGPAMRGGWAAARIEIPRSGAWRLDLRGASMAYVNGEPHAGDVYNLGLTRIPLALEAGTCELLFRTGRGRMRAALEPAPSGVYLEERDRTVPDALHEEPGEVLLGHIVSNATDQVASGLIAVARAGGLELSTDLADLPAESQRKLAIRIPVPEDLPDEGLAVELALNNADGVTLHTSSLTLGVRSAGGKHARTFVSEIDGSVQYYAVTPPSETTGDGQPALVLSLHGASVEARNQAFSYGQKPDLYVVAPTNRRPYGFDWEDWGRRDAIEVLELASERFGTDPRRTYLTGHSMGGHGTWQVGAHFPDRFAAIAPSAGWRDFWSYAGGGTFTEGDPVGDLFTRAVNTSRTRLLDRNYLSGGVYVLHGDADNNVPVTEARAMRARLAEYHPNFAYYERAGAGHWWGNACVDWPPLFEFFADNVLPAQESWQSLEFVTVNPAVSSSFGWLSVQAQEVWLEPSRVVARLQTGERRVSLETSNVTRLALDLSAFAVGRGEAEPSLAAGAPVVATIDGSELELTFDSPEKELVLHKDLDGSWSAGERAGPEQKGPHRAGPFKEAFGNRMLFVYATRGTPEENAWSRAKARYDHETWRYRGNGAVDLIADVDLDDGDIDRGVILYGHREMNAAWDMVLADAPFDANRGGIEVDGRLIEGDDLALLAVHPRRGSDTASVAVIAGTGLEGMRTTDNLPYWVSGVAYPDWTVLDSTFLDLGLEGIRGAGFFNGEWSTGEGAISAWRE